MSNENPLAEERLVHHIRHKVAELQAAIEMAEAKSIRVSVTQAVAPYVVGVSRVKNPTRLEVEIIKEL